ncbi:MAG: tRNA (adenosine(37)-N6)-threonylcarbamoyltransferase complex dimerization subunit type 1 TsaB [Alphaproteobacteria bacterium]|nr:tRNA (adenosine(37)-N6)-threonylcarbamoyltransferase complex dimerization subunit type 1 TsaB [Alphaproteobacteria bacterium]
MKFIALDLSLSHLIMVYGDRNNLYYQKCIPLPKDRAGILFTNLEKMISELKIDLDSIDMLFSTVGPGNFNGIRISLSLIKGLAIAKNIKIAGLSSLELMSRSFVNKNQQNICTIIKASPDFYYLQIFDEFYRSVEEAKLININEKIKFPFLDSQLIIVGNDSKNIAKTIKYKGNYLNLSSSTPEGLYLLVKDTIKNNNYLDANPKYLREVNAVEPSLWKRKPIVN